MIPRVYTIALVLPGLFAAIVLAATALNGRSGRGPTILTEREVVLAPRTSDRSVAEVWLTWTEPAGSPGAWLTAGALETLGFDVTIPAPDSRAESHYRRQLSRRGFVAFEIDGPAWQAAVAYHEEQRRGGVPVDRAQVGVRDELGGRGSRLVPVAVDSDADALAERYPEARTHLIAAAIVRINRFDPPGESPYIGGSLVNIDPRRIQIPSEHAAKLPRRTAGENPQPTPYAISLMYGRRWEPWVVDVGRR